MSARINALDDEAKALANDLMATVDAFRKRGGHNDKDCILVALSAAISLLASMTVGVLVQTEEAHQETLLNDILKQVQAFSLKHLESFKGYLVKKTSDC